MKKLFKGAKLRQKRALVVYHSSAGYTRHIAKDIADIIPFEVDLTEVKSLEKYDLFCIIFDSFLKGHHKIDTEKTIFDCDPYNLIFVGSPVSAFYPAPPINSWISMCENIGGKDVAFFITYWRHPGVALREMERMLRDKGAKIVDSLGINPNEIDSRESELALLKRFVIRTIKLGRI